ncbi:MAG: NAD(+)/NADH kinase [Oscillospiraceae bacterium]|jgi:NAD+ kinase|nr:NAD(+)/NADH kinase [Oscillospiraceae bacterium]
MKKVILSPNPGRDKNFEMTRRVNELLRQNGAETVVCPLYGEGETAEAVSGVEVSDFARELPSAALIITFGGDGSILRAARLAAGGRALILGVNMGGKGFMAELECADVGLIPGILGGGYTEDRRMMLDVSLTRDGEVVYTDFALNDVVVAGVSKVVDLAVFGDGQRMTAFSGDGVIVATPTGSTAYSMAAGGPIVEPSAHNILITPICAHVLQAKPFVLASDRRVDIEIGYGKRNPAYMTVDGCANVPVCPGDALRVRKSDKTVCLAHVAGRNFYKRVSEKLGDNV